MQTLELLPSTRSSATAPDNHYPDGIRNEYWEQRAVAHASAFALYVAQKTGSYEAEVSELFSLRTEGIHAIASSDMPHGVVGNYDPCSGVIRVKSGVDLRYVDPTIAHETAHAVGINRLQKSNLFQTRPARQISGLHQILYNNSKEPIDDPFDMYSGWWLNEALVTSLSSKSKMHQFIPGYNVAYTLLTALFEHDQSLEPTLLTAAHLDGKREIAIRAVDALAEPGWTEKVGAYMWELYNPETGTHPMYTLDSAPIIAPIVGEDITARFKRIAEKQVLRNPTAIPA